MGTSVHPWPKLLSAYAPANRGRFQSRDNHPSTSNRTFLSNHRGPSFPSFERNVSGRSSNNDEDTFSRRGYIWSNIRASVRSRETERERKRWRARERERVRRLAIQLRYKGQGPRLDGRIPGRRRQYFIIQTKHTASEFLILCYFNFQ